MLVETSAMYFSILRLAKSQTLQMSYMDVVWPETNVLQKRPGSSVNGQPFPIAL